MELHKIFDSFIMAFKVFSLLTLTIIFLYWSATAIIKFKSLPTTSTVAYRFGDDGHGNIDFPAITICLDSFQYIARSLNGMKYKCHQSNFIQKFYESLEDCTAKTTGGEKTPTFRDFLADILINDDCEYLA